MKLQELQEYFKEAKSSKIRFEGTCHDCKSSVCIDADIEEDGKIVITGGALFSPQIGITEKDRKLFLKCESCYEKNNTLQDYQPCAVYSRVVGFLRPVSDWNPGKQAEFKKRKLFKNI